MLILFDQVRFRCAVYHATSPKLLKARGEMVVTLTFASWNRIVMSLRQLDSLRVGYIGSHGEPLMRWPRGSPRDAW